VSGQVIQVNWRATRIKTWSNDMIVMPNSAVSKAVVTNHSRPRGPHRCIIRLKVDFKVPPSRVIDALREAASGSPDIAHGSKPAAYACEFSDSLVAYELAFAIDSFALTLSARSAMLRRVADTFQRMAISIGTPPVDVRIVQGGDSAVAGGGSTASIPAQAHPATT
jgi:small-conductance mechanosensitive channel